MKIHTHPTQAADQFDLVPDAVRRLTLAAIDPFLSLHASRTASPQSSVSTSALGWRAGDAEAMRIDEDVWLQRVAASLEEGGPLRLTDQALGIAVIKDRHNRIRDVHVFPWLTLIGVRAKANC